MAGRRHPPRRPAFFKEFEPMLDWLSRYLIWTLVIVLAGQIVAGWVGAF